MTPLQATGKTMNDYVNSHQDKSRNAMNKAVEASFQAWVEELRADQAQFTSEKVMNLDLILDILQVYIHMLYIKHHVILSDNYLVCITLYDIFYIISVEII